MTSNGILQMALFFGVLLLLTKPLGAYMARVFQGERTFLTPVLRPVERLFYKLFGVNEDEDMRWTTYAFAMLMFSVVGALLTYALLRLQGYLPFNPKRFTGKEMTADLAFNTAMSFTTNTNWQNYVPEAVVSYFSNMVALAWHNWMSAATGIAVAIAVVRGFARHSAKGIGNFWVDYDARHSLHPAADLLGLRALSRTAGRSAELRALHAGEDAGRRGSVHRAGAGRIARMHQDAWHQRRRLLQRQLRASLREPDAAHQPHRDALYLLDRSRADLHLRQNGGQHKAGLGHLWGDGLHVHWRTQPVLLV